MQEGIFFLIYLFTRDVLVITHTGRNPGFDRILIEDLLLEDVVLEDLLLEDLLLEDVY